MKVKKQAILKQCKDLGLKSIDQINSVMAKYTKKKDIKVVFDQDDEDEKQQEQEKEGEIPAKDFDYLLSMPIQSLSQEKIEELVQQMNKK